MNINKLIEALILVATIGGGFLGFTIVLSRLPQASGLHLFFAVVPLILFLYIIYVGLVFSDDKSNIRLIKIALL